MAAPGPTEQLLATLHVEHSSRDGSIVAAVVQSGAHDVGLDADQGEHLALAAGAVARAVYLRGFEDPDEAALDMTMLRIGHLVTVRIDDRGLPFNAEAEDELDADVIEQALLGGWIDGLTHESLGRDGNRTTLVRHVDPGPDLRDGTDPATATTEPAPVDEITELGEVTGRLAVPADVEGICRLTWRTYGYSYQHDEYYQPERLASMIESGLQASFVVVRADGEIIGHSALLLEEAGDVIVEGGRAMVDPRYRGHHLMGTLHDCRDAWMDEHGILALEGAAVTAHTRSQTDHPVMSVQLGFLPAISFRGIEGTEVAHREAVVGGMFAVAPVPPQAVHLPARDAAMMQTIYRLTELERSPAEGAADPDPGTASQLRLDVRADLGHAVVTIGVIGADLGAEVQGRVATVVRGGVEVVYADIPLDRPEASWAADVLAAGGFVFSGVLPLAHGGVDAVRYQWLGEIVVDPDEIHLKHPFSRELLDYVLAQRAALPDPA